MKSLAVCLIGFVISFAAIEIMDSAITSLTSIFVPANLLLQKDKFINTSFIHVFTGNLGRSLGCFSVYLPCLLNETYAHDLSNSRYMTIAIQISLLFLGILLIFFVYQKLELKIFHKYLVVRQEKE